MQHCRSVQPFPNTRHCFLKRNRDVERREYPPGRDSAAIMGGTREATCCCTTDGYCASMVTTASRAQQHQGLEDAERERLTFAAWLWKDSRLLGTCTDPSEMRTLLVSVC